MAQKRNQEMSKEGKYKTKSSFDTGSRAGERVQNKRWAKVSGFKMRSDEERQLKSLGWLKKALEQNGPKKWERWSQQENGKAAKENGKAGQARKRQMVGLDLW